MYDTIKKNKGVSMTKRSERISYEEVASICDLLKEAGVEPSQTKVYAILQRGSNSTIAKYISQWTEKEKDKPVKLKRTIIRSVEAEIEKESYRLSVEAENRAQKAIIEAEEANVKLATAATELNNLYSAIEGQKKAYSDQIEKLLNQIDIEKLEKETLSKQINEKAQDFIKMVASTSALEAQNKETQKSLEKAEKTIERLHKEKENALLEIGKHQAIIDELKNQLKVKEG